MAGLFANVSSGHAAAYGSQDTALALRAFDGGSWSFGVGRWLSGGSAGTMGTEQGYVPMLNSWVELLRVLTVVVIRSILLVVVRRRGPIDRVSVISAVIMVVLVPWRRHIDSGFTDYT